jgi:acyl-CoA synthetase (AMP-forming)/AMP-acid ligase II
VGTDRSAERLTADGWLRTGDVARIDDDGFVWIEGRASDMVNRGGLKIHPAEVEEVLRSCAAIADAAVVGRPDERLGEVPVAFCVPADPTVGLPPHDELERVCREQLAGYKVPVSFAAIDRLPRNEIGKVLKHKLLSVRRAQ